MFSRNFFTKNGFFIYSKHVFQVRYFRGYFYTREPTENIAMVGPTRNNSVQILVGSNRSRYNLQKRLSLIRERQVKQEKVATSKGNEEDPKIKLSPIVSNETLPIQYNKEAIEQTKLSSILSCPVIYNRKQTISERLALRHKKSKIETDQEVSKNNIINETVKSALDKELTGIILETKSNKSSNNIVRKLTKDVDIEKLNEKGMSTYDERLQKFKKIVKTTIINGNNKQQKNVLQHNELLASPQFSRSSLLKNTAMSRIEKTHEKKRTMQERLVSKTFLSSGSNANLNFEEPIVTNPVSINFTQTFMDTSSPLLTNFDLNLKIIDDKMSKLTINDTLDERMQENQPRILSHHARLENFKKFVFSDGHFKPALSRKHTKPNIVIEQYRHLSTERFSDRISSINKEDQPLELKLGQKELSSSNKSSDCQQDINCSKTISSTTETLPKLTSNSHKISVNVSDINNGPSECKHITVETLSEIMPFYEKFPFPKNNVHNYYQLLSKELQDKSLKIDPCYKLMTYKHGTEWTCTYHLKWPENCKVSAKGLTKKRASSVAALKCLAILSEHGKISPDGLPLIYNKDELHKVTKKKLSDLKFDDGVIAKMQDIIDIFKNNMNPVINSVDYKYDAQGNKVLDGEADPVNSFLAKSPVYLGLHEYFAKEKVVLPISEYKESFIKLMQNNNCVIVKGEPGCGKSSRVPQYVLEAWAREATSEDNLCRIAVTQPRRIAAISLAERVASERNEQLGRIVGYQVRLKSNFQTKTGRILYCTTGILLRHIQSDPNLTKFSHVILDEAHERDVNTDLLMNLLKKALDLNNKLKVVIMSATIDADKFSEYFEGSPVFNVPGFTYPVTKFFLDSCKLDVSKTLNMCEGDNPRVIHEDVVEILGYIHKNKPEGAILTFLPGWEDLVKVQKLIPRKGDLLVHLVHSKLKDSEQYKIFARPPPGIRKIILSTNIAETSITIDDVVYVVDAGLHKEKIFDNGKGINVIDMEWISKASANQRAGRAGRCSPGESYHLYTQERFNKFLDYTSPKVLNSSLTKVVLDSKVYTNNMDACDFMNGLITPPEEVAVKRAVDELKQLELLDENEKLTPLGRTVVNFQLEPNLAKVMVNAVVFKCTSPIIDIVTLFSSDTGIFGSLDLTDKDRVRNVKSQFCKSSDHLALMRVYEKWLELREEESFVSASRFCKETNLVPHKLEFVTKLKDIHFGYLYSGLYESLPIREDFSDCDELVKAVIYSGTGTVLEHRNWDIVKNRLKTNANVLVTRNNQKATITSESVNYKRQKFPSNFLVYINETRSNIRRTTIVRECSLIPPISVLLFSNKKLEILKADPKNYNVSDDMVIIGIKNTKQQFVCDRAQANILLNCKEAIDASYKYLIHQLTYAGEDIPEFLEHWDSVLRKLSDILETYRIE